MYFVNVINTLALSMWSRCFISYMNIIDSEHTDNDTVQHYTCITGSKCWLCIR